MFENHALLEWARRPLISLEGLIASTLASKGCMASWLSWHEVEATIKLARARESGTCSQ